MGISQTQDENYQKIASWLPGWFLRNKKYARAYVMALAKASTDVQAVVDSTVDDTFITRSKKGVLDTHGAERSVERLGRELDSTYAVRVQNLFNNSNPRDLKAIVDQVLVNGVSRIVENDETALFIGRGTFCNRGALFLDPLGVNMFSVIVNRQIHAPYSFCDRDFFANRGEAFIGTSTSLDEVFDLILRVLNDHKAFGTQYQLIELLE